MRNYHLPFLIIFLLLSHPAASQRVQTIRSTDTRVQVEKIADSTLVFLYPDMADAVVNYEDGQTIQAKLNYSILLDQMQIQTRRGILPLETKDLKTLRVENATFIHRGEEGYFEVFFEGKLSLYLKRQIIVSAMPVRRGAYGTADYTSSIDQASSIQTNSTGDFNREIFLENPSGQEMDITLRYNEHFIIEKGGTLVRVNNARQLQRDFPEYRNELRDFLRGENINFSNRQHLVKLVKFMEDLK